MEVINFVGEKLEDVILLEDVYFRIYKLDGIPQMLFRNHLPDRYNFEVENGIIINQRME